MKKRRALALLLALSLAVGTNGMTVLAAGTGEPNVSVAIEEGAGETVENQNPIDDQQPGDSVEDGESDGQDEGEIPGGEDDSDNPDKGGDGQDQDGDDADNPDEGADDVLGDEGDTLTPDDEIDSEETEEAADETETDEESTSAEVPEVKMVTFTDDTGFKITYNAVAATSFEPSINDGVLTAVPDAKGVVDLREETTITSIGANALKGNTEITYVMLPKTVTEIGSGAFEGCTGLKGISIPSRLTTVGDSAFKGCTLLTQLALPNSVTSIGANAFNGDNRLFMVHMVSAGYSKLTTIGESAFEGCSSLELFCSDTEYYLPSSLTFIGNRAFYGCRKIRSVSMGDEITLLGEAAYQNCSGITAVLISSGLTEIPSYAFANCTSLLTINFSNTKKIKTTIKAYAFSGCTRLGSIELTNKIDKVEGAAFKGCTSLKRVVVKDSWTELEDNAFPNENPDLCLVGDPDSNVPDYARKAGIRFVTTDNDPSKKEYYTYTAQLTGPYSTSGQLGIKVTKTQSSKDPDINSIKNKDGLNGVTEGTTCYVYITNSLSSVVQVVSGSVKCNGEALKLTNGYYTFRMPVGGATISVEFENKVNEGIVGDKDSIEGRLSSDVDYDFGKNVGHMKVGQTTTLYLINHNNGVEERIPASQVTYSIPSYYTKGIISVDKSGNVKALKEGTSAIDAKVKTTTGDVNIEITIVVESVGIDHISLQIINYDKNSLIPLPEEKADNHTGVTIPKTEVTQNYTFNLKAAAFTSEDNAEEMAVAFTWATSDAKVAKLAKTSTTATSAVNTVTIPINTDGEATITVTATDANKKKVTQKFIVSVEDYTPRLSSTKITINPKQVDGATKLEIIGAYGKGIVGEKEDNPPESIDVYDAKTGEKLGISLVYEGTTGEATYTYKAIAVDGGKQATYSVKIRVKVKGIQKVYEVPLSVVVKESVPNPTVSFDKKKPKINLFYKNGGTQITPVISKLGTDEISSYSLEPLTNSDDDVKFTNNFAIDSSTGVITQKADILECKSNKPVVTGYLVLRFKNYKENVVKKYKITIPTETVAPSYVLNKTSATYNKYCAAQTIELQLLDKKNKKVPVVLDESNGDKIEVVDGSGMTRAVTDAVITEDGKISLPMDENPVAGKVYLKLTNDSWANGKSFTYVYTIKTNTANPTLTLTDGSENLTTLKSSTLTINPSYKEQVKIFGLKSNQADTEIWESQDFEPQFNAKTKEQYDKLSVTYEDGVGHVSLTDEGANIKPGTYTFVCKEPQCTIGEFDQPAKKVTLKVKVAKSVPTVTTKGSLSFNAQVKKDGKFTEKGELTLTVKNLPENYTMDDSIVEDIVCTTKNCGNYAKYFDWKIVPSETNPSVYTLQVSMETFYKEGTYKFSVKPRFTNSKGKTNTVETAKAISFSVKVYRGDPTVSLSAKGKLNLLDRTGEYTTSNSIVYTPTMKNVKDTVAAAEIYDADGRIPVYDENMDNVSDYFRVEVLNGKLYVSPKDGAVLENNKTYKVQIWMKLTNYSFASSNNKDNGGIWSKTLSIKTAQVLPKVITDKSEVNLYLSNKDYTATFTVNKKDIKSVGAIESIAFGEKDTKALESFEIVGEPNPATGKLTVKLKLKNGVAYSCNTTNKITMYVKFKGQGSNTAGTAITMKVKINK